MTLCEHASLMFDLSIVVNICATHRQEKTQLRYNSTATSLRNSVASFSFIDKGSKKLDLTKYANAQIVLSLIIVTTTKKNTL